MSLRPTWDERCPTLGYVTAHLVLVAWRGLVLFSGVADRLERWVTFNQNKTAAPPSVPEDNKP